MRARSLIMLVFFFLFHSFKQFDGKTEVIRITITTVLRVSVHYISHYAGTRKQRLLMVIINHIRGQSVRLDLLAGHKSAASSALLKMFEVTQHC